MALLRASAAAWNVHVRVYRRTLRNYSYAYLELRRALKLRVLIGQSGAHSGMRDIYI